MKNFIKGTLFGLVLLPAIDLFVQIMQQASGFICTFIAAKTYKISKDLPQNQEEECGGSTFAIGFQAPSHDEEEYYDEDDE